MYEPQKSLEKYTMTKNNQTVAQNVVMTYG
jgi:hypothetical protein